MDITELIIRARDGNEDSFAEICEQYSALLHSMSRKYAAMCVNDGDTADDFLQEAKMALYTAIKTYKLENGTVTFGAYAKTCIRNSLVSCVRRLNSKKRRRSDEVVGDGDVPLQDTVIRRELGERLILLAENTLSPYEKRIFALHLKGHKTKAISQRVGKSEKSVSNAIFRIRSKLKKQLKTNT